LGEKKLNGEKIDKRGGTREKILLSFEKLSTGKRGVVKRVQVGGPSSPAGLQ